MARETGVEERLKEIGEILAAGLVRLKARKSSQISADAADKPVDFEGVWSGDPADQEAENSECPKA